MIQAAERVNLWSNWGLLETKHDKMGLHCILIRAKHFTFGLYCVLIDAWNIKFGLIWVLLGINWGLLGRSFVKWGQI